MLHSHFILLNIQVHPTAHATDGLQQSKCDEDDTKTASQQWCNNY